MNQSNLPISKCLRKQSQKVVTLKKHGKVSRLL